MEYIVWNSQGRYPPQTIFATYEDALKAARAMANHVDYGKIYVAQLVSVARVERSITFETLKGGSDA